MGLHVIHCSVKQGDQGWWGWVLSGVSPPPSPLSPPSLVLAALVNLLVKLPPAGGLILGRSVGRLAILYFNCVKKNPLLKKNPVCGFSEGPIIYSALVSIHGTPAKFVQLCIY